MPHHYKWQGMRDHFKGPAHEQVSPSELGVPGGDASRKRQQEKGSKKPGTQQKVGLEGGNTKDGVTTRRACKASERERERDFF